MESRAVAFKFSIAVVPLSLALLCAPACDGTNKDTNTPERHLVDSDRDGLYDPGSTSDRIDKCPRVPHCSTRSRYRREAATRCLPVCITRTTA